MTYSLTIKLVSDATFGSGDGVAGEVDTEVEHDTRTGLPRVGGRTLRGLLVEECANLLWSLNAIDPARCEQGMEVAARLWGMPGSRTTDEGNVHVGSARMSTALSAAIRDEISRGTITREEVLDSLTCIRRQTAVGPNGAPAKNTLRTQRAVLRETALRARLTFRTTPTAEEIALLADCVRCVRRGGIARTRGRGRLQIALHDGTGEVKTSLIGPEVAV